MCFRSLRSGVATRHSGGAFAVGCCRLCALTSCWLPVVCIDLLLVAFKSTCDQQSSLTSPQAYAPDSLLKFQARLSLSRLVYTRHIIVNNVQTHNYIYYLETESGGEKSIPCPSRWIFEDSASQTYIKEGEEEAKNLAAKAYTPLMVADAQYTTKEQGPKVFASAPA